MSPIGDSAAKRRADKLSEELGLNLWAKYPAELMEFRMDRPPKEPDPKNAVAWQKWEEERRHWKPVHGPKVRVYSTYMRYSWCWPICLPYAVVTDDRDEILRDHKGRPLTLTQERVAEMLELSQQRVTAVVLDLIAEKLIRTAVAPGRSHSQAVYLEAKPVLTKEERRDKSTIVATGVEGPRLEPAVLRRFSYLFKQLGDDDSLISVPTESGTEQLPVAEYRSQAWKEILDSRTLFLKTLKTARYSERKAYGDTATRVRNLISQRESPEVEVTAAADVPASSPAPAVSRPPVKSTASSSSSAPPAMMMMNPRLSEQAQIAEAVAVYSKAGNDWVITRLISEPRGLAPDATIDEIVEQIHANWHLAANQKNPLGYLVTCVRKAFTPVVLASRRARARQVAEEEQSSRARERERRRANWQGHADDPHTSPEDKAYWLEQIRLLDEEGAP